MKAVQLDRIGHLIARDVDTPKPRADELLVRVEACGICGTDRHILHGDYPSALPVILGHEFSGIVEEKGVDVSAFSVGQRVTGDPNIFCGQCHECRRGRVNHCRNLSAIGVQRDGGMAEYVVVPQSQAVVLPDDLPPTHGAFCEPLACCLHGIDVAAIAPGDSVAVLGGGVIGLLMVQLARLAGASTIVLSTRQEPRRRLASELGATHVIDPARDDPITAIRSAGGIVPEGVDVVLECAGVDETFRQGLGLARRGGTVLVFGVMPAGQRSEVVPFDILFNELRIEGAFINPFTHSRAAAMIASGVLELDRLTTRAISLDQAPEVIMAPPRFGEVKTVIVPHMQ